MRRIPLGVAAGLPPAFAIVDDEDFGHLRTFAWRFAWGSTGRVQYAVRSVGGRRFYMHREILGCQYLDGTIVDHRNGDGLDNRRENLRIATNAENGQNRGNVYGFSRYRGVTWAKGSRRWRARATLHGRVYSLGSFSDELEAARAVEAFWREHNPSALDASPPVDAKMAALRADFQRRQATRQITADIDVLSRAALTPAPQTVECPHCDHGTVKTGEGWKAQHRRCVTCHGTGRVLDTKGAA